MYKTEKVSGCHNCENCRLCSGTNGEAFSSEENLYHVMACMVKKGLVKVARMGSNGPAWTLTALGINDVEQRLIPELVRVAKREKTEK